VLLSLSLSQLCFMLPRDQCKFRIWDYEYISFILFYIRKISFNFISFVELCFSLVLLFFCSVLFKALIFFFISSPFYFNFCLFSIFFSLRRSCFRRQQAPWVDLESSSWNFLIACGAAIKRMILIKNFSTASAFYQSNDE